MAARRGEEESIYAWTRQAPAPQSALTVKTYNVPAPPAAPRPKMHVDSSQVEALLNPVRGIRDAQARAGITPTNHSRHNILAIKEQSRLNGLQKQAEAEQAASTQPFRPQLLRRTTSGSATPAAAVGRTLSGAGLGRSLSGGGAAAANTPATSSGGGGGAGRNFVAENRAAAAAAVRPVKAESRPGEAGGAWLAKPEYGAVPAYLLERRLQLAAEADAHAAAQAAAQIPPGLRQLPEAERLQTLELLGRNQAEVEARLAGLPIIIETPSQIRHKDELERRLREIESAQKIFSRPNVLVHATPQQS